MSKIELEMSNCAGCSSDFWLTIREMSRHECQAQFWVTVREIYQKRIASRLAALHLFIAIENGTIGTRAIAI